MKTEAKIGVMYLKEKKHQGSVAIPEAKRKIVEQALPQSLQKGHDAADTLTLNFQPLELRKNKLF